MLVVSGIACLFVRPRAQSSADRAGVLELARIHRRLGTRPVDVCRRDERASSSSTLRLIEQSMFRGTVAFVATEIAQPVLDTRGGNGALYTGWAIALAIGALGVVIVGQHGRRWRQGAQSLKIVDVRAPNVPIDPAKDEASVSESPAAPGR